MRPPHWSQTSVLPMSLRGGRPWWRSHFTGRSLRGIVSSYAEALAAAAALAHVGVVEAQAPGEAFLHELDARALQVGKAQPVHGKAHAGGLEDRVVVVQRLGGIEAVAEARAAGRLDGEPHGDGA